LCIQGLKKFIVKDSSDITTVSMFVIILLNTEKAGVYMRYTEKAYVLTIFA